MSKNPAHGSKDNCSPPKANQNTQDWDLLKQDAADSAQDDSDSELSESDAFLVKGAFLLTPSYELSMEKASSICEKMNFKSAFSLTKTATGILFKFANPEDYQAVFKKGFHKVTGARFYKKIPIPCRPQKTFVIYVQEIPEDIPEEDIRHSLYKFNSVVEVTRITPASNTENSPKSKIDTGIPIPTKSEKSAPPPGATDVPTPTGPPPIVRITLANMDEANSLLQNGLDFYGATYFPTDTTCQLNLPKEAIRRVGRPGSKFFESTPLRVPDGSLPVFDAAGFQKISAPAIKTIQPESQEFGKK